MPNWCQNTVSVRGKNLSKFVEWLGDGKGILNKIAPTPKVLAETTSPFRGTKDEGKKLVAEFGADNWYDWNIANWGTKWDVDADISEDCSDKEVVFSFDSAWGPPIAAMEKMSVLFPDLTVRHSYLEEGMCFVGVAEIENGETNDTCHEDPSSEEWKDMAREEFGWEPWPDDEDSSNEEDEE